MAATTLAPTPSPLPGGTPARAFAPPTGATLAAIVSWPMAGAASFVFLSSLPYKFTNHPDTAHIFSTIGAWIGTGLGDGLGQAFSRHGAYLVGSLELLSALALLAPIALWAIARVTGRRIGPSRARLHAAGGAMAAMLMAGAVFFHLQSPLGTIVVRDGVSDGGALFRAALTVLAVGVALVVNAHLALGRRQA